MPHPPETESGLLASSLNEPRPSSHGHRARRPLQAYADGDDTPYSPSTKLLDLGTSGVAPFEVARLRARASSRAARRMPTWRLSGLGGSTAKSPPRRAAAHTAVLSVRVAAVAAAPPLEVPAEDRNRTSPFPYGGHRFEVRRRMTVVERS